MQQRKTISKQSSKEESICDILCFLLSFLLIMSIRGNRFPNEHQMYIKQREIQRNTEMRKLFCFCHNTRHSFIVQSNSSKIRRKKKAKPKMDPQLIMSHSQVLPPECFGINLHITSTTQRHNLVSGRYHSVRFSWCQQQQAPSQNLPHLRSRRRYLSRFHTVLLIESCQTTLHYFLPQVKGLIQ